MKHKPICALIIDISTTEDTNQLSVPIAVTVYSTIKHVPQTIAYYAILIF